MKNDNYELSVKINDNKLPEYGAHGKTYIRGEIGREFTLYFKNNTAERILARFSVDGLSVLDGKDAGKDKSGYICNAYSTIEINGWRTSLEEVRKFEFSSKGKSYAGKTVGKSNCGVIGVQVFSEKKPKELLAEIFDYENDDYINPPKPYPRPRPWKKRPYFDDIYLGKKRSFGGAQSADAEKMYKGRSSSMYLCSSTSPLRDNVTKEVTDYNLGTKFGEAKKDVVKNTTFEIDHLISEFEIYYTDRDGLEKAGVELDKKVPAVVHPKAFGGFCQPPED